LLSYCFGFPLIFYLTICLSDLEHIAICILLLSRIPLSYWRLLKNLFLALFSSFLCAVWFVAIDELSGKKVLSSSSGNIQRGSRARNKALIFIIIHIQLEVINEWMYDFSSNIIFFPLISLVVCAQSIFNSYLSLI
jgi:hypothetical protein